jgi:hypothetical protein
MSNDKNKAAFLEQKQVCKKELDDYLAQPEESQNQEKIDLLTATSNSANECFINYNRARSSDSWATA